MTIEIFEKHPTADAYKVGAAFTEYCILAKEKRFSDGELAAEYWSWKGNVQWWLRPENKVNRNYRQIMARILHRAETMSRFARRPHAHETDYR